MNKMGFSGLARVVFSGAFWRPYDDRKMGTGELAGKFVRANGTVALQDNEDYVYQGCIATFFQEAKNPENRVAKACLSVDKFDKIALKSILVVLRGMASYHEARNPHAHATCTRNINNILLARDIIGWGHLFRGQPQNIVKFGKGMWDEGKRIYRISRGTENSSLVVAVFKFIENAGGFGNAVCFCFSLGASRSLTYIRVQGGVNLGKWARKVEELFPEATAGLHLCSAVKAFGSLGVIAYTHNSHEELTKRPIKYTAAGASAERERRNKLNKVRNSFGTLAVKAVEAPVDIYKVRREVMPLAPSLALSTTAAMLEVLNILVMTEVPA